MADEQRVVIFRGDVQGVGFRFTATHIAQGYDITGYVRNVPDGTVEVVAEGEAREIDRFIQELAEAFSGYIRSQTQEKRPPTGEFVTFGVKR